MKIVGYVVTTALILLYASVLNGLALSVLWLWFVVKKFDLPALSLPEAIGIALVVSYLTHQVSNAKNEDTYSDILVKGVIQSTIHPMFVLAIGAIVKLWS